MELFSDAEVILHWEKDPVVQEGLISIEKLKVEKASYHSENFIRLLLAVTGDIRVVLVKMDHILEEVRKISQLPKLQQKKVAGEAYYMYAPIAHRLGFYGIKTELEDRSMKVLFPEDYFLITRKLKETERERNAYLAQFIKPVQAILYEHGFHAEIKGRSKSIHSIWKKMYKQQVPFEEVYDLLAIRIIFDDKPEDEKADCWKIYSLITSLCQPNPARLRDWISAPKPSGYEALHSTVQGPLGKWVEIQIRSRRMDEVAEKGEAAHWRYKSENVASGLDDWLNSLREKIENPQAQTLEEELTGQSDFHDPHIFVFTPQGDLLRLMAGSTILDFAFNIHSSIGEKCTGARVNGKILPIRHELKNGDTVEIQTSKNQKPNKDWLQYVVSARTRQKIRKILRDEELAEAEAGKELLYRKLQHWKISFPESMIDELVRRMHYRTHLALFQAIATGKEEVQKIRRLLKEVEEPLPAKPTIPARFSKTEEKSEDVIYLDRHLVNINYSLAKCCNPVFGDPVFGFITISRGVTIHRQNCPNAAEMQRRYRYRIALVKWRKSSTEQAFQTTVKIQGVDDVGILNTISSLVSVQLGINIRSISMDTRKGIFSGTITVYVKDHQQLDMMMHQLLKVKGVMKVSRVEGN